MTYVEWLRVRGALKWTAIVLGALFLIGAIVRVALIGVEHNALSWVARMQNDPGSKVSDVMLPDGTHRITIDTRDRVHIVIDDHGWNGKHIEILDPTDHSKDHESVSGGSMEVRTLPSHGGSLTVIDTNGATDFPYFRVGTLVGLIVATILGAPFARENDGHLELALTRPASRTELALRTIGIDAAGILAAVVLGVVFAVAGQSLFELPHFTFTQEVPAIALAILAPLAIYAALAAATASLKRGYGTILGFAWPAMILVLALSFVQPGGNTLLTVVHAIFWPLSLIDPLAYIHFQAAQVTVDGQTAFNYSPQRQIVMLAVLGIVYSTLAIVQWRRVEA